MFNLLYALPGIVALLAAFFAETKFLKTGIFSKLTKELTTDLEGFFSLKTIYSIDLVKIAYVFFTVFFVAEGIVNIFLLNISPALYSIIAKTFIVRIIAEFLLRKNYKNCHEEQNNKDKELNKEENKDNQFNEEEQNNIPQEPTNNGFRHRA